MGMIGNEEENTKELKPNSLIKMKPCGHPECTERGSTVEHHCEDCGKSFCMSHRLPKDHQCPKQKTVNVDESTTSYTTRKNRLATSWLDSWEIDPEEADKLKRRDWTNKAQAGSSSSISQFSGMPDTPLGTDQGNSSPHDEENPKEDEVPPNLRRNEGPQQAEAGAAPPNRRRRRQPESTHHKYWVWPCTILFLILLAYLIFS